MSYETGTATDVNNLLSKIATFAAAHGWTIDYNGARTSGTGNAVQLHKGSSYATFLSDTATAAGANPKPWLKVYRHESYTGGNTESQAGMSSSGIYANNLQGPFQAYYLFSGANDDYLYIVIESEAGLFHHVGIGTLTPFGVLTNGDFCYALNWYYGSTGTIDSPYTTYHNVPWDSVENTNSNAIGWAVRADFDAISPRWNMPEDNGATYGARGGPRTSSDQGFLLYSLLVTASPSDYTQRTILVPCLVQAARGSNLYSLLGYPPGVRWVNMTNITPGDALVIGSDTWRCFPVAKKNGQSGEVNSAMLGYAYLQ
jgi:hypothetical protein